MLYIKRILFSFLFLVTLFLVAHSSVYATTTINSNIQTDGIMSVGTTDTSAKLNIFSTTENLRLVYDNSNYVSFTSSSSAGLSINLANDYGKWTMIGNAISPSFVAGYKDNALLGSNIEGSAILSGGQLTNPAYIQYGWYGENIIANNKYSVITGGDGNRINWPDSGSTGKDNFIGDGSSNFIEKNPSYSVLAGGELNKIISSTGSGPYADFLGGGGQGHVIDSNGEGHNVLLGGQGHNHIYGNGYAVVGGGGGAVAWDYSFVGGSTAQAGSSGAGYAVAAGGYSCPATGAYSMNISGGYCYSLASGEYSFASGVYANATHDGSFIWTDSNGYNFPSSADNSARFRATGGMRFVTAINGSGTATKTLAFSTAGNAIVTGGIKFSTTDTKPTCDVSNRGYVWFIQGATTVKDSFEVCAKDATNAYLWRTIY